MKKSLNMLFFIIVILFVMILTINKPVYAAEEDVYDVILFWGQSNMTGYAGIREWEHKVDTRVEKIGLENFSKLTGIRSEILGNAVAVNNITVKQVKGTAFEYIYSNKLNSNTKTRGSLKELNEKTVNVGQKLVYNTKTGLLDEYSSESYYSIQKSYGTNMIPQFCNQYYKRTGHKVVVVMCANGGEKIANFLPSTDKKYGDVKKQYIYESMVEKYKSALKYLEENKYKVGKKLYVVYQGESDVSNTSKKEYKELFLKVHNYLKKDLGITKGAIILSGGKAGVNYENMKKIYNAQVELISESEDLILGSAFAYKNYVPSENVYEKESYKNYKFTDSDGNKLSYKDAVRISRYSVCYNKNENNEMHFTSAALSQIGYEVANAFSKINKIEIESKPNKTKYYVGENLNTKGLKLKITYLNGDTKSIISRFECTPTRLDKVGNQKITVKYKGKTATFNVTVKNKKAYYTNNLKEGDTLKLKEGYGWWTYKKYTYQNPYYEKKCRAIIGGEKLKIVKIDGNWLKVKIMTITNKINKNNFKVGDMYYIYYGSTASKYFNIVK